MSKQEQQKNQYENWQTDFNEDDDDEPNLDERKSVSNMDAISAPIHPALSSQNKIIVKKLVEKDYVIEHLASRQSIQSNYMSQKDINQAVQINQIQPASFNGANSYMDTPNTLNSVSSMSLLDVTVDGGNTNFEYVKPNAGNAFNYVQTTTQNVPEQSLKVLFQQKSNEKKEIFGNLADQNKLDVLSNDQLHQSKYKTGSWVSQNSKNHQQSYDLRDQSNPLNPIEALSRMKHSLQSQNSIKSSESKAKKSQDNQQKSSNKKSTSKTGDKSLDEILAQNDNQMQKSHKMISQTNEITKSQKSTISHQSEQNINDLSGQGLKMNTSLDRSGNQSFVLGVQQSERKLSDVNQRQQLRKENHSIDQKRDSTDTQKFQEKQYVKKKKTKNNIEQQKQILQNLSLNNSVLINQLNMSKQNINAIGMTNQQSNNFNQYQDLQIPFLNALKTQMALLKKRIIFEIKQKQKLLMTLQVQKKINFVQNEKIKEIQVILNNESTINKNEENQIKLDKIKDIIEKLKYHKNIQIFPRKSNGMENIKQRESSKQYADEKEENENQFEKISIDQKQDYQQVPDAYLSPDDGMPNKRISIFDRSQINGTKIIPENSDYTKTDIFPKNSLYYLENENSQFGKINKPLDQIFRSGNKYVDASSILNITALNNLRSHNNDGITAQNLENNYLNISRNSYIQQVLQSQNALDKTQAINIHKGPPSHSKIYKPKNIEIEIQESGADSSMPNDPEMSRIFNDKFNQSLDSMTSFSKNPKSHNRSNIQQINPYQLYNNQLFLNLKQGLDTSQINHNISYLYDNPNFLQVYNNDISRIHEKTAMELSRYLGYQQNNEKMGNHNVSNNMTQMMILEALKSQQDQSVIERISNLNYPDQQNNDNNNTQIMNDVSRNLDLSRMVLKQNNMNDQSNILLGCNDQSNLNDLSDLQNASGLEQLSNKETESLVQQQQMNQDIQLQQINLGNIQKYMQPNDNMQIILEDPKVENESTIDYGDGKNYDDRKQTVKINPIIKSLNLSNLNKTKQSETSQDSSKINKLVNFFHEPNSFNKSGISQIQNTIQNENQEIDNMEKLFNENIERLNRRMQEAKPSVAKKNQIFRNNTLTTSSKKFSQEQKSKIISQRKTKKLINLETNKQQNQKQLQQKKLDLQEQLQIRKTIKRTKTLMNDNSVIKDPIQSERQIEKKSQIDQKLEQFIDKQKNWMNEKKELHNKLKQQQIQNDRLQEKIKQLTAALNFEISYNFDEVSHPEIVNFSQFMQPKEQKFSTPQKIQGFQNLLKNQNDISQLSLRNQFGTGRFKENSQIINNQLEESFPERSNQFEIPNPFQDKKTDKENKLNTEYLTCLSQQNDELSNNLLTAKGLQNLIGQTIIFNNQGDPMNLSLNQASYILPIKEDQTVDELGLGKNQNFENILDQSYINKQNLEQNIQELQQKNEDAKRQNMMLAQSFFLSQQDMSIRGTNLDHSLNLNLTKIMGTSQDLQLGGELYLQGQEQKLIQNISIIPTLDQLYQFQTQLAEKQNQNLDETDCEIGEQDESRIIRIPGNAQIQSTYNFPQRSTLDNIKQLQAAFQSQQLQNSKSSNVSLQDEQNSSLNQQMNQFQSPKNQKLNQEEQSTLRKTMVQKTKQYIQDTKSTPPINALFRKTQEMDNQQQRGTAKFQDFQQIHSQEQQNYQELVKQTKLISQINQVNLDDFSQEKSLQKQIKEIRKNSNNQQEEAKIFEQSDLLDNENLRQNKKIEKIINFDNLVQSNPPINEPNTFNMLRGSIHQVMPSLYHQDTQRHTIQKNQINLFKNEPVLSENQDIQAQSFQSFSDQIQDKNNNDDKIINNSLHIENENKIQGKKHQKRISYDLQNEESFQTIIEKSQSNQQNQISMISCIKRDNDASYNVMMSEGNTSFVQNSQYMNASFLNPANITQYSQNLISSQLYQQTPQTNQNKKVESTPFFKELNRKNFGLSNLKAYNIDTEQSIEQNQSQQEMIEKNTETKNVDNESENQLNDQQRFTLGNNLQANEKIKETEQVEQIDQQQLLELQIQQQYLYQQQLRQQLINQELMNQRAFILQQQQQLQMANGSVLFNSQMFPQVPFIEQDFANKEQLAQQSVMTASFGGTSGYLGNSFQPSFGQSYLIQQQMLQRQQQQQQKIERNNLLNFYKNQLESQGLQVDKNQQYKDIFLHLAGRNSINKPQNSNRSSKDNIQSLQNSSGKKVNDNINQFQNVSSKDFFQNFIVNKQKKNVGGQE